MNHHTSEREKDISGRGDGFNATLSSKQKVFEDSAHPNLLESSPYHLHGDTPGEEALRKIRTANSVSISPGNVLKPLLWAITIMY